MKRTWLAVAAIALVLVLVLRRGAHHDACALAQTWTAGDVHQYEVLALAGDGSGRWSLGSYDDAVEPDAQDLTWAADDTTLVVTTADGRRSLPYALEPMRVRCRLSLDAAPLPRSHERTWYTGGL